MAHGKHRRSRLPGRSADARSIRLRKESLSDQRAETGAEEIHDPLHQGADLRDAQFSLMACEHPGACSCESDYPNWSPGQR